MRRALLLPLAVLALSGCFGRGAPPPRLVPVPTNCVTGDIPDEPPQVQAELTGDSGADIGIIAGSAIMLRAWGRALHGMLTACAATPASTTPLSAPAPESNTVSDG